MKNLQQTVEEYIPQIDQAVARAIGTADSKPYLQDLAHNFCSRPGKRVRPILFLLSLEAFRSDLTKGFPLAVILEILHDWLLIHDDIEDESEERRGKPTLNQSHGIALSLNAGDFLTNRMWEQVFALEDILGPELCLKVAREFTHTIGTAIEGQSLDIGWIRDNAIHLSKEDYLRMCMLKTSGYSVIGPCRLAALLAGIEKTQFPLIEQFGIPLGISFQITDDVLNLIGDEKKYGKEIAGDIWEGKRTLMIIDLLQRASAVERQEIQAALGKSRANKKPSEIEMILSLMHKYEIIGDAQNYALEQGKMALQKLELSLQNPNFDHNGTQKLYEYAEKLLSRDR